MNKFIFRRKKDIFPLVFALAITVVAPECHPDEGLWLPHKIPAGQLKSRMDFTVSPEWIAHWQKSSLGVATNGSGSFVSPEGLILTNWHVAMPYLQAISSSTNNYVLNGFIARTRQEEIRLPRLTLYSESWEDVTDRVLSAANSTPAAPAGEKDLRAIMDKIADEAKDGYSGEVAVIETARGAEYTLHKSKTFSDIRLVMAPEYGAACFGGDIDNFEYPRFWLDMTFLRAYEDNMPVRSPAFFRFSKDGVREGDRVFVAGLPAVTERRKSLKYLEFKRDHSLPGSIELQSRIIKTFEDHYAKDGKSRSKDVVSRIFTLQNILKGSRQGLNALNDASTLTRKKAGEEKIKQAIARDPELGKKYGRLFAEIDRRMSEYAKDYLRYDYGRAYGSALARNALLLVEELARNKRKPNAGLSKSLANKLFLKPSFEIGLEERLLRSDLEEALKVLGPRDKYVKTILCGRDPEKTAHNLVTTSKYADAEFRKELLAGGWEAVLHTDDPLIKWALKIQAMRQKTNERKARQTEELDKLSALYVKAVSDVLAGSFYPDPADDLILRLSYGEVAGYKEDLAEIPYQTTFAGLYERSNEHNNRPPFALPGSFISKRNDIDIDTPLNFVSTVDMARGNSGSPVFNRKSELVGVLFDGNSYASGWDYVYSDEKGRAIALDVRAIVESLRNIYNMDHLVRELLGE